MFLSRNRNIQCSELKDFTGFTHKKNVTRQVNVIAVLTTYIQHP